MACRCKTPIWAQHILAGLNKIQKGIEDIMALVQVDQAALDTLAASLEAVKSSLATEIAALGQALPAADLTGINKALTDLEALEAPAPPAPAP